MNVASFDKSRILELSARIGEASVPLTLTFKDSSGADYDITGKNFEFKLKRKPADATYIFTLTEASGLTVIGTNQLRINVTASQATQRVDTYFWRLISTSEDHTWLNGYFRFHNGEFELEDDQEEDIIIYENGAEITITINETGSGSELTLTTTGTSGPSTLVDEVLNIPEYGTQFSDWDASTNLAPAGVPGTWHIAQNNSTTMIKPSGGIVTAGDIAIAKVSSPSADITELDDWIIISSDWGTATNTPSFLTFEINN